MNLKHSKYRVTYEAFSKFSGKLSTVQSLDDLTEITRNSLKYLFNYHQLSILVKKKNHLHRFSFTLISDEYSLKDVELFGFEEKVFQEQIPILLKFEDLPSENLKSFSLEALQEPEVFACHFNYSSLQVCATIFSDEHKHFGLEDIEILRLVVDAFMAKYQQIFLQKKLKKKNKTLKTALTEIENKNVEIEKIVDSQKEVISERTKDIEQKNERLVELLQMNSHNLREPLSRILGLLDLAEMSDFEEFKNSILPYLKTSSKDLDTIFREVILKSSQDIKQLSVE